MVPRLRNVVAGLSRRSVIPEQNDISETDTLAAPRERYVGAEPMLLFHENVFAWFTLHASALRFGLLDSTS